MATQTTVINGQSYTGSYTPIPASQSKVPVNMTVNPNAPATILKNASTNANLYTAPTATKTSNPLSSFLSGLSKFLSYSNPNATSQTAGLGVISGGNSSGGSLPDYSGQPVQQTKIPTKGVTSNLSSPLLDAGGKAIAGAYNTDANGNYYAIPMQSLSSGISPDLVNGVQKTANNMRVSLQDIMNDPFKSNGTKEDLRTSKMEGITSSLGKLFPSTESLDAAYNTNSTVKTALDAYISNGGTLDLLKANIQKNNPTANPIQDSRRSAVQDLFRQGYTDPSAIADALNYHQDGTPTNGGFTPEEVKSMMYDTQDTLSYLQALNTATKTDPTALMNLPPEEQAQQEIMRQMGIPDQYRKLMFGSPEKIGQLEVQKTNAEKQLELYDEKLQNKESDLRSKAQVTIDKYRAQQSVDNADIESKRLQAKNYLMGYMAKLGILNISGQVPVALTSLEAKYDAMKVDTDNKYSFAIRDVEINLNGDINDAESAYADKEQSIKEDLTKSVSDVSKELLKIRQDADSKIYSLTSSYQKTLTAAQNKYQATSKTNAQRYLNEFGNLVGYKEGVTYPSTAAGWNKYNGTTSSTTPKTKTTTPSTKREI